MTSPIKSPINLSIGYDKQTKKVRGELKISLTAREH